MSRIAFGRIALLLAMGFVAAGCAKQLDRIETRVDELSREQRDVFARQIAMAEDLGSLRSALDEEGLSGQERRAELHSRLESIERNVERMLARSGEQQALLLRLRDSLDLLAQGTAGSMPPAPVGEESSDPTGGEPAATPVGSSGSEVFDAAYADFTRGTYTLARQGFQEVLDRFGSSELADDAQYWIAETYYAQGDYAVAKDGFARVLQGYPRGDTLAPALLKLGYCEIELGNENSAAVFFRRLQSEYPDSDEAMIAEHKLSTLRGAP